MNSSKNRNNKRLILLIPLFIFYCLAFSVFYFYFSRLIYGIGHYPWKPYTVARINPNPEYLPGTIGPTLFSTNHRGFRGDDPYEADLLILVLGGSTTEGFYLDDKNTWPQVMANKLNKNGSFGKVVAANAAKAGLQIRHYYLQAMELLPELEKVRFTIILPGPNDVMSFYSEPYKKIINSRKLDEIAFGYVAASSPLWSRELIQSEFNFFKNIAKNQIKRLLMKIHLKKPSKGAFWQDSDGAMYKEKRRDRLLAEKIDLPHELYPMLDERLEYYRKYMRKTIDEIILNKCLPVLVTHPVNYFDGMPETEKRLWYIGHLNYRFKNSDSPVYLTEKSIADLLELFNQVSRDLAVEYSSDVILIDLAEILKGKTGLYYDSWHFNIEGAKQVGEIVADALIYDTVNTKSDKR